MNNSGIPVYPLTNASQVVIDEIGTRLGDGKGNLNITASGESSGLAQEAWNKANEANAAAGLAQSTAEAAQSTADEAKSLASANTFSFDAETGTLTITIGE